MSEQPKLRVGKSVTVKLNDNYEKYEISIEVPTPPKEQINTTIAELAEAIASKLAPFKALAKEARESTGPAWTGTASSKTPQGPIPMRQVPKTPWKPWHNNKGESATVKSLEEDERFTEFVKAVKQQPMGKNTIIDGLETWWAVFDNAERVHRKFKVPEK